jgi:hypothetical protein
VGKLGFEMDLKVSCLSAVSIECRCFETENFANSNAFLNFKFCSTD